MDSEVDEAIDDVLEHQRHSGSEDVGLINPNVGAGIMVRENGKIEAFSDYGLGFSFDPETQSLNVFAPNINIFHQNIEKANYNHHLTFFKNEYEEARKKLEEA